MERKSNESIVLGAASPTSSLRPQLRVAGACQPGLLAPLPRLGFSTTGLYGVQRLQPKSPFWNTTPPSQHSELLNRRH